MLLSGVVGWCKIHPTVDHPDLYDVRIEVHIHVIMYVCTHVYKVALSCQIFY